VDTSDPDSRAPAVRRTWWQRLAVTVALWLVLLALGWVAWLTIADTMTV
jgi:hypothetical protein